MIMIRNYKFFYLNKLKQILIKKKETNKIRRL